MVINEGSALFLTFSFTDENDNAIIPATIKWRVDDKSNSTEILAWAAVATPAASVNVSVPGLSNEISDETCTYEKREVTVMIDEGLDTQAVAGKEYKIKNLHGHS